MCGIIGVFSRRGPVSPAVLERATMSMYHRGPDGQRQWVSCDGKVGLGHARLSIIDIATGDQPIASEDERTRIVVNGEFYGFEAIQKELESRGHRLRTRSDSEIALHLYEDFGTQCLHHLRGEFAMVIWDQTRRQLMAARDRFGIKPLFYAWHEEKLYLASEAKALWAAGVPARWDEHGVYNSVSMSGHFGHSTGESNQSFSLGAPHLIAANIVVPAIGEFRLNNACFRIELFDERAPILQKLVQEGKLDMALGIFGPVAGIRRALFLRFPLVVIRPERDQELKRASMTWSALNGENLVCLQPASPIQQVVDRHLSRSGSTPSRKVPVNLLDTQIAMVEAGEGVAAVPSYSLLASRHRKVIMSRLINPVAEVEFSLISYRGVKLPAVANDFTDFLKSFFARWATNSSVR